MSLLRVVLFAALCGTDSAQQPSPPDDYDDDVRLVASVLKTYNVHERSPQQAIEDLFEQALGKGHGVGIRIDLENRTVAEAKISLELHDVPATQVLIYIAELSGCRLKFWGRAGAPEIELQAITQIDDTDVFYGTQSFECTKEGARRIGLHANMSNAVVQKLLAQYGVEFPEEAIAFWNEQTHRLAVRNRPAENSIVAGIVRVANKGFEFIQTPAKKDAHKKQE